MILKSVPVGAYQENCYFLIDETTNEAVIFDPGAQENLIFAVVERLNIKPVMILLTHGHFDHVGSVEAVRSKYNIPFYINKTDEEMQKVDNQLFMNIVKADNYLNDGDKITFGNGKEIKVITTPGHTPGGVCFLCEDILVTGDTLFNGSIGRTDFTGGDFNTLISSIKNKVLPLGDSIRAFPGHGPETTIGYERNNNPYILGDEYVY
ncbi:MBL fold metallo-hydrolase [uncultured Clostridium sp.]|uniref:MBL fold metallo-hydrolase n=1 Tax=uncultured Clostridium sp. TaxID=59620 RepID=UPI002603450C|nr:MBL fold metallo-hydrolase [uncultured Clostridium sp.]